MSKPLGKTARRRPDHGPPPAAVAQPALSAALLVIWGGLALYLLTYFLTPLANAPRAVQGTLRRGHLWAAWLLADETVGRWFEGVSTQSIVQRLSIMAWAGAIVAAALLLGWVVLIIGRFDRWLTRLEQFVFAAAIGLSLVPLTTLACGLAGALQPPVFATLAIGLLAVAAATYVRTGQASNQAADTIAATSAADTVSWGPLVLRARWLWLCTPFLVVMLASALLPPLDFDVREYHLQAPKEFYELGRITFLPHNVYANMPLGAEMFCLLGMVVTGDWWWGALVGKLVVATFAPLTALALFTFAQRFVTSAAGVVAAVAYLSLPWVMLISTQGLVEGTLACYLFLGFYAAWLWRSSCHRQDGAATIRWAALTGFMAGSAASIKYPGLLYCVAPLALWLLVVSLRCPAVGDRSSRWGSIATTLMVFALATGLACGPWLAKNIVLTGNPTYPLLDEIFGHGDRTAEQIAQWNRAHRPPNFSAGDLFQRAAAFTLTSDWLSPLVVPLALLAIVLKGSRPLVRAAAGYIALVFILWWLLTHRIERFWTPVLPLTALLAGIGAVWSDTRWWRGTLAVLAAIGLPFCFAVVAGGTLADNRYLADLPALRDDPAYIETWHLWLNEHVDDVSGVLLVADAQPFDLRVPALYNTVFDACIVEQLARGKTADELQSKLRALKISHVYVAWHEIARYRSPGNYGITDYLQPKVFDDLVEAGVLEPLPPRDDSPGRMYRLSN